MENLLRDIRFGLRMLVARPAFTAVAVLTLGLGIGANTAIFSVVNSVLLRPLPYADPDRLVYLEGADLRDGTKGGSICPPDFLDYRRENQVFERLAAFQSMSFTVTGDGGDAERLTAARVSAGFFETFGVAPIGAGRTFSSDEEQDGRNGVVVISYGLWQRRFGGDPGVLGRNILINGQKAAIVGVMPASFQFPRETEVWSPIAFNTPQTSVRRYHFLNAVGRLKPGVSLSQAQADMTRIARDLSKQYPESNLNYGIGLTLFAERIIGQMRQTLLILLAAVGFVLLIACANVANLMLARSAARQREVAIRSALGASRGRVIRQLLTESVLLAMAGGAVGLLLAVWGVDSLVALGPQTLARAGKVTADGRVLGFTLLISLVTGVLFGLAPALAASKLNLTDALKEGSKGSESVSRHRLRSLLIVSEVALSLILLVGAGLLIRSFMRLSQVDPGFNPSHLLTMQVALTRTSYPEAAQRVAFFKELISRVEALPGVEAAGTVSELPLSGQENDTFFTIEGKPAVAFGSTENDANVRTVSTDYFRAMGISLISGRSFSERDTLDAPKVILINEAFARRYLPGEDPIGKRMTIDYAAGFSGEIIGVVRSVNHTSLQQPVRSSEMYVSDLQAPPFGMNLVVRAGGDPARLTSAIRAQAHAIDNDVPLYNVKTMERRVAEGETETRFRTLLLAIFAGVAVLLAAIGIYGVISYSVTQRTHEIGIRIALGAERRHVVRLVVGQGMIHALVGIALGLCGAFAVTRLMASVLFQVSATDPVVFGSISVLLGAIAFLACYIPARRALRIDPMVALRYE